MAKIEKSEGINESERKLAKLGEKVFLGLWSYPNVYYKPAKELTDLLVVCDEHVLIFSDKNIKFDDSIDAWQRWHRRAVLESIEQLRRAERIIKNFPNNIFLDSKCIQKIPIPLPSIMDMKIHLICVANGATEACKRFFGEGCSGSLIFDSDLETLTEFHITDYDKTKTFVHVFDDFTFPFVLNELDTLRDFVVYLTEKERVIRKAKGVIYTGEEDLLLNYLTNFDEKRNCRAFLDEAKYNIETININFVEEDWDILRANPQYIAKKQADEVSYMWDRLIQKTACSILDGSTISEKPEGSIHEGAIRYMALENRVNRRFLSERMIHSFSNYPIAMYSNTKDLPYATMVYQEEQDEQVYFFLQIKPLPSDTYEQYRERRKIMLNTYGLCLKAKFVAEMPSVKLKRIIGIAMEPPYYSNDISEDFFLLDCSNWTDEEQFKFDDIRRKLNIWRTHPNNFIHTKTHEYPEIKNPQIQTHKKIGRNDPCPCGSGKKYKKCCLNKSI